MHRTEAAWYNVAIPSAQSYVTLTSNPSRPTDILFIMWAEHCSDH